MKLLGQEKLLSIIDSYTYSTYPKSAIILGSFGSGKHTLSSYIAKKFNLDMVDITKDISQDFLNEISLRVTPSLYIIDASEISDKQQNMILKFLEEPTTYSFILILAENRVSLLPTILNRCVIFEFRQYSKDILSQFVDNSVDKDLALSICSTPGQLKALKMTNLSEMKELCVKMVQKSPLASFPNMLSISEKLNYKDDFNKYDVDLFFSMLTQVMFDEYRQTNTQNVITMYLKTIDCMKKLVDRKLNRRHLVENYLSNLWQEVRQK
jgi:replication-associated recombination protein RarA